MHEYNKDFYAWSLYNAGLIREGNLSKVDLENVAEEIESMGKSNRRELISRLVVLLAHLLKWQFQPGIRSKSWKLTIQEQRFEIQDLINESPSLKYELDKKLGEAYKKALRMIERDTGLIQSTFPAVCPFTLEEAFNQDFYPE